MLLSYYAFSGQGAWHVTGRLILSWLAGLSAEYRRDYFCKCFGRSAAWICARIVRIVSYQKLSTGVLSILLSVQRTLSSYHIIPSWSL